MKKFIYFLTILFLHNLTFAQTAKIKTEHVTPHMLEAFNTNSVSAGLDVAPKGTYVYLSAQNVETELITDFEFTLISKPEGSTAEIEEVTGSGDIKKVSAEDDLTNWVQFLIDLEGTYVVGLSITTASGTHDTTKTIYSAEWIGVGNFQGITGDHPKCFTCHSSSRFTAIYDKWEASGHAEVFSREVEISDHYSTNCMKCHTTGYDHNIAADNGGFDDVAADLGWSYTAPGNDQKFDSIVTEFPGLVNLATIGCEMCHGPGSMHVGFSASKVNTVAISLRDGACAQCHDEPWRHNKVAEYENSLHSQAVFSSSFARKFADNSISGNCARCHEAQGYVSFTKGEVFDGSNLNQADHVAITCATCHEPHSLELRQSSAASDTLGNGFSTANIGGKGNICMDCHKARRDADSYAVSGTVNSHWGPHHSTQTDVLLGQNAASFGTSYISGSAHYIATSDACVTCHMDSEHIPGQNDENRNFVAGHTFRLHNPNNGYVHTAACTGCHGPKENFEAFQATMDYDYDGTIESIREEIAGLEEKLRIQLPPTGIDSISYADIQALGDENTRKAYYNYQLIAYDGSGGMHNAKFAIDVLTKSFLAVGGVIPVELISFSAELNGSIVNLNWQTATEKNNRGFDIQRKTGDSWNTVGFVQGKGTTSEVQQYSFTDKVAGLRNGEKLLYRLKQMDYDGSVEYSKEVEITFAGGPDKYTLEQNYPNPFNPVTTIKYSLPYESKVKVVIYNIAGEVVSELLNTVQTAGSQEIKFDASDLNTSISSGIYFYSLEANSLTGESNFREVKKMVLIK